ncbi:MAG: gluconate 2-dehydrogenase subunit 3 family protein [Gammaproteobacteria bacterium]|nr:gluconate 2-dehydrogenase subunit 3 family protein [Gammaproteobacteria bacterium]
MPEDSSRRQFLQLTGSAFSGTWLASHWPALLAVAQSACVARDKGLGFSHLAPELAADIAAIAAQIIPTDDTPGATEAGVIYFIDGALDTIMKGAGGMLAKGVNELNARLTQHYGSKRFSQLDTEAQLAVLRDEEQSALFGTVRFLTVAGMFAMPQHGANKDRVGWDLLGFDSRHGWQPPFGHYDAEETSGD